MNHAIGSCMWLLATLLLWASASPSPARADRLAQVAQQLTPYQVADARVFDSLAELALLETDEPTPQDRNAARFLRTMASVDLWLIAELRGDRKLGAKLAEHWAVPPGRLAARLKAELSPFARSVYADVALDARNAVERLEANYPGAAVQAPRGVRESLVLLLQAGQALEATDQPLLGLAALSADPCQEPGAATCSKRFAHFGPSGRRAARALENAHRAYRNVKSSRSADPLLAQLSGLIDAAYTRVLPVTLQPDVQLAEGPECQVGDGCSIHRDLDVLVVVHPDHVELARAPRIHLGPGGEVVSLPQPGPVWPETVRVALPSQYPGFIRHIDSVVDAMAQLSGDGQALRIGVSATPDSRAHVWARVVLSARQAGAEDPQLLGRGPDGGSRVASLRVVTAFGAPKLDPSPLSVFVLMRGHSVRSQGNNAMIERAQGEWNYAALSRSIVPGNAQSAQLRFLPDLSADTLLRTALAMGPVQRTVTVILP